MVFDNLILLHFFMCLIVVNKFTVLIFTVCYIMNYVKRDNRLNDSKMILEEIIYDI